MKKPSLDDAVRAGVDVRLHTKAPMKMRGVFEFNCSPEKLWPLISTANGIASWFPIISGGRHDNTSSQSVNECDVGAKRYCQTVGMGQLDETILHWDPPHAYAYNVRNKMMPIKNHLAVMIVEPTSGGRCRLTWLQYFDYKGVVMRHLFPAMMLTPMNIGLRALIKRLDGGRVVEKMHHL